jgi:diguanylate cyclase (GGDEF)-like protein
MARTALQLDDASSPSRGARVLGATVGGAYVVIATVVAFWPSDPVVAIPSAALTHSVSLALVGLVTAVLVYGYSLRTRNPGYLVLADTFVVVSLLGLALPLAFPGAFVTAADGSPSQLLGGLQSPISLFYAWHLVMYVGVGLAAVTLQARSRSSRGTTRLSTVVVNGAGSVVAALLISAWALFLPDRLPEFITDDLISPLARSADWLLLVLATLVLVLILAVSRGRSAISRWLIAVAVVSVGEAAVNVGVERYSVGWYFNRAFGVIAATALLLALVWEIARSDRLALSTASHDSLTRALSRAAFESDVEREVAVARHTESRLALLWLDVDNFKSVNDRLGYGAGDEVLRELARRLEEVAADGECVARVGGDEFAVALPDVGTPEEAERATTRIIAALTGPMQLAGSQLHVSCSIGLAMVPDDATSATELAHKANLAMYEAKSLGGDRMVSFRHGLDERVRAAAELRSNLALALDEHEFEPYAQPIVDAVTRQVVGLEMLLRWRHDGQVVPAADFIREAEASHLIVPIGRQVRALVADALPGLLARNPALEFVTVNLSVAELDDPETIATLRSAAWRALAPFVVLEVTESAAWDTAPYAWLHISELRATGFRLAVDDFGTGFSTLTRLEDLRPFIIKSDRSLLRNPHLPQSDPADLLQWVHGLCQTLGSTLVVEGIETLQEMELARGLGAGVLAQGYLYGRPVPLGQVTSTEPTATRTWS